MQTRTYRQGLGVSILYFIRALFFMGFSLVVLLSLQFFVGKEFSNTLITTDYPFLLTNDFALICSVILGLIYAWFSLSINVKITADDRLQVRRNFIRRCDVDMWTTKIKVVETTSRSVDFYGRGNFFINILSPKRIKIVVVNPDNTKTKINATGLGVNNANTLREQLQLYSDDTSDVSTLHSTQTSPKPKNKYH